MLTGSTFGIARPPDRIVKLADFARGGNSLKLSSHFMSKGGPAYLEEDVLDEPLVVFEALLTALERIVYALFGRSNFFLAGSA